jgi:hypothetical protein
MVKKVGIFVVVLFILNILFIFPAYGEDLREFSKRFEVGGTVINGNSATAAELKNRVQKIANDSEIAAVGYDITFISVSYSGTAIDVKISMKIYSNLPSGQKRKLMTELLTNLSEVAADMPRGSYLSLYNFIASTDESVSALVRDLEKDIDVKDELPQAYLSLKPFQGTLGIILGVFALLTAMLLGLVMVIDLAYITLPLFRAFFHDEDNKERKRLKLISHSAYMAVLDAERSKEEKSALALYFKDRVVYLITLSIVVFYLISGTLYVLLVRLINTINHIITVLF